MHKGIMYFNRMYRRFVLLLMFSCMSSVLTAQDTEDITFRSFTTEWAKIDRGLSQNSVFSVIQDSDGFMWFGTWDGLNKFDAYNFTIFRPVNGDTSSIVNETIRCMHEDESGYLWLGTETGLSRLDRYTLEFKNFKKDINNPYALGSDTVFCLTSAQGGLLYVGTNNGFYILDKQTGLFQQPDLHLKIKTNEPLHVFDIADAGKGFVWLGTNAGLIKYDVVTGNKRIFDVMNSAGIINSDIVLCLLPDTSGMLWIGTTEGLTCISTIHNSRIESQGLCKQIGEKSVISALYKDKKGRLWIGTQGEGIVVYDRARGLVKRLANDPASETSLYNNYVNRITGDKNGNIWVATSKGVSRVDKYADIFAHYVNQPGNAKSLSNNTVWSIMQDEEGLLWIGTDGGVTIFDRKSNNYKFIKKGDPKTGGLSSNMIRCIVRDSEGDFWMGTSNAGINRFNKKTGKVTVYINGQGPDILPDNQVWSATEDRNGNMWFGTMNGLALYDRAKNRFSYFRHSPNNSSGLSSNVVYGLYTDKKGYVWVSTYNGLNRLDPVTKRFIVFKNIPGNINTVSNNRIFSVYEDKSGYFWIATMGGGLNRYEPATGRFRIYTENEGLANNIVYNILEDSAGNLWMSTNYGLSKFDRASETFINYDIRDGIQSSEFNLGAACKLSSGELAFGGMNGFNIFSPERFVENTNESGITVTSFKVFNKPLKIQLRHKDTIELSYYDNFFSFGFSSLDFSNPDKIRYGYMLDNLDRKWTYTDASRRFAEYTNVPPGQYVFRVKATNSQGFWGKNEFRLYLSIQNVWWRTLWFRSLVILVILLISGYFIYDKAQKIRKKHLWEKQKLNFEKQVFELRQKALTLQMNPHFIFNTLNSIQHFILRNNTDDAIRFMGKLSQLMRLILTGTREIYVPVINEVKTISLYLDLEKIRFGSKFEYAVEVDKAIDSEFMSIPPMLIQPFVENAVLHGIMHKKDKGFIQVTLLLEKENIRCIIEDDGVGREEAMRMKKKSGMGHASRGISIIADRLSLFEEKDIREKRITIEDRLNEAGEVCGTRVEVLLPLSEL